MPEKQTQVVVSNRVTSRKAVSKVSVTSRRFQRYLTGLAIAPGPPLPVYPLPGQPAYALHFSTGVPERVLEDLGRIPTVADWLLHIQPEAWMLGHRTERLG
jgi:hypothetical protein